MAASDPQIQLQIGGTTLVLNRDGTMTISGTRDRKELFTALEFFAPPSGGREWWPRLLVYHIHKLFGDEASSDAVRRLFRSNTRRANARNAAFVEWTLQQGLPGRASVEAVDAAKSILWDSKTNTFRNTSEARFVLQRLLEGKSWETIEAEIS